MTEQELYQQYLKETSAPKTPSDSDLYAQYLSETGQSNQAAGSQEASPSEADLGFFERARYAIEPIQSSRVALLQQQLGSENVRVSPEGEPEILQRGYWKPVNAPGFSVADVAEIAGALPETVPEIAGGLLGGGAGLLAGAPTGPGAIATGAAGLAAGRAAGGAAGSVFRQALSTALGTPQEATIPERAQEVGMSALTAPIGGAIADFAAPYAKKIPGLRSLFGGTETAAPKVASEAAQAVTEEAPVQIAKQVPREMEQQSIEKLSALSKRQGLPEFTYAQAVGGEALTAEGKVLRTPLISGKVRKQVDRQLTAIKGNLEKVVGDFIDADSTAFDVGVATQKIASGAIDAQKKVATELYDKVDVLGKDAMVGKGTFFNKFRDFAGEHGLINPDLTKAKYSTQSPYTREEFKTLQDTVFDAISAIKENPSPKIRFDGVNAQIKKIKRIAENIRESDPNSYRILKSLQEELNSTAERTLNREAPKLGEVFKEANKNYAKFKGYEETYNSIVKEGIGSENVVKTILGNTDKIEAMKEIIGPERMKEVGISYLKDIMSGLGKQGNSRAQVALQAVKANKDKIIATLGRDAYDNSIDNLTALVRVNQPITITRDGLYTLIGDAVPGLGVTGLIKEAATFGGNVMKSKGISIADVAKKAASPVTVPYSKTIGRGLTRDTYGNVLSSPLRKDIQMTKSGDKFIRTGSTEKKENYRSPSEKFTRKKQ